MTTPVLAYPLPNEKFILDTDASDTGIGAVLSQKQSGEEKVVAYASRSLTKAERNYCTTRKELLALVFFVKHFRHYLYGQQFLVRTDHQALKWLFKFKEPEGQLARWVIQLSEYNFEIEHRPGKLHVNADSLSRLPCKQCGLEGNVSSDSVPMPGKVLVVAENVGDAPEVQVSSQDREEKDMPGIDMGTEQRMDADMREVISWVENQQKPDIASVEKLSPVVKDLWSKFDQLCLVHDVLCITWEKNNHQSVVKTVVPRHLVKDILFSIHSACTGGHLGIAKTGGKVKGRFYWLQLWKDVEIFCQACEKCATRKNPGKCLKGIN